MLLPSFPMAVMNSSDGQEGLMACPHYDPSGNIDGCFVTVYRKTGHVLRTPRRIVLVRDTYANGVSSSRRTGVISSMRKPMLKPSRWRQRFRALSIRWNQ